ncbi:CTLH domain-containing protein, partial [Histoplasma capsulatum]
VSNPFYNHANMASFRKEGRGCEAIKD